MVCGFCCSSSLTKVSSFSLGAASDLVKRLLEQTRPAKFYWNALLVAAGWFAVIVLLVKVVEWLNYRANRESSQKI